MATQILPGGICKGIRRIEKPDSLQVHARPTSPGLYVTENGDTRWLPISPKVAEVLIAYGLPFGA